MTFTYDKIVDKNQGYGIFLIRLYYVHFIAIKINELSFLCLGKV